MPPHCVSRRVWKAPLDYACVERVAQPLEITVHRGDVGALPVAYVEESSDGLSVTGVVEAQIDLLLEAIYRGDAVQVKAVMPDYRVVTLRQSRSPVGYLVRRR